MLEINAEEVFDLLDDEGEHLFGESGVDADPQGVVHDRIGVTQFSADTVVASLEVGLTRQVSRKQ